MSDHLKRKIRKFLSSLLRFYRLRILKDPFTIAVTQWFKDEGNSNLRFDYPLTEDSIVFDVGGYIGEWSQKIIELYNPHVYIFEPVPEYYSKIIRKLGSNPKVSIYNFGLSNKTAEAKIALLNNGSSVYKKGNNYITIELKDISEFLKEINISKIDLIKINIEGEEYALLNRMISTSIVEKCQNIQVQFHKFVVNARQRRNKIRGSLRKTHFVTWEYPFIWENWRRK